MHPLALRHNPSAQSTAAIPAEGISASSRIPQARQLPVHRASLAMHASCIVHRAVHAPCNITPCGFRVSQGTADFPCLCLIRFQKHVRPQPPLGNSTAPRRPMMAEPTVSPMAPELLPAGRLAQATSDFPYAYIPLLRFRENQGTLAIFQISQISQLLDKKSMQTQRMW
jgi:hypothetical protein